MLEGDQLIVPAVHYQQVALDVLNDLQSAELILAEECANPQPPLLLHQRNQRHHRGDQDDSFHFVLAGYFGSWVAA